jgi:hypothetical protein
MSKRAARFTQADLARCIRAAKLVGAAGVEIRPDGTIEIKLHRDGVAQPAKVLPKDKLANWDDVLTGEWIAPPAKTKPRRLADRIGSGQQNNPDPLAAAFARWEQGEITADQLPPGRYPNGMRVYADGEWEAIVRSRPLGKMERAGLAAYFEAKGTIGYVKGGGQWATERLAARGFVEVVQVREDGRVPYCGITPEGEAAWLALSSTSGNLAKE